MVKASKPEYQSPEAQKAIRNLEDACKVRGIADENGVAQFGPGQSKFTADEQAKSARLAMKSEYKERMDELVSGIYASMAKEGGDRETQKQQALATLHSMIGAVLLLAMRLNKSCCTLDMMLNSDTKLIDDSNRDHFKSKLMGITHACAECAMFLEAISETMEKIK